MFSHSPVLDVSIIELTHAIVLGSVYLCSFLKVKFSTRLSLSLFNIWYSHLSTIKYDLTIVCFADFFSFSDFLQHCSVI